LDSLSTSSRVLSAFSARAKTFTATNLIRGFGHFSHRYEVGPWCV